MLEWAGVSFGEEFTYKLGKSMKVRKSFLVMIFRDWLL